MTFRDGTHIKDQLVVNIIYYLSRPDLQPGRLLRDAGLEPGGDGDHPHLLLLGPLRQPRSLLTDP